MSLGRKGKEKQMGSRKIDSSAEQGRAAQLLVQSGSGSRVPIGDGESDEVGEKIGRIKDGKDR